VLPEEAWWRGYYGPLEARVAELESRCAGDPAAEIVLTAARSEIDAYRRHADEFSYAFFVAQTA